MARGRTEPEGWEQRQSPDGWGKNLSGEALKPWLRMTFRQILLLGNVLKDNSGVYSYLSITYQINQQYMFPLFIITGYPHILWKYWSLEGNLGIRLLSSL